MDTGRIESVGFCRYRLPEARKATVAAVTSRPSSCRWRGLWRDDKAASLKSALRQRIKYFEANAAASRSTPSTGLNVELRRPFGPHTHQYLLQRVGALVAGVEPLL
jgi:hypothetical protein